MKQILVVGSDPKISSDLDKYFDPKEYKLLVCPQSKSVITSLMNAQPDLVIFDLNSMDNSAPEIIKKTKELNSDLPLIVLSDLLPHQMKEKIPEHRACQVLTIPVQMEKLVSMVKQVLSSIPTKPMQRVFQGSTRLSSHEKGFVKTGNDADKSPQDPPSPIQDYHHLFEQMLSPVFEQIIRDCSGHIYERLLSGLEKTMITWVLKSVNHNQVKASQLLGISRNTLRERMKKFDIF